MIGMGFNVFHGVYVNKDNGYEKNYKKNIINYIFKHHSNLMNQMNYPYESS